MLRVVPGHRAGARNSYGKHYRRSCKSDLDRGRARHEPLNYCRTMADQGPENCDPDDYGKDKPADLNPRGNSRQKKPDDLPDATGQWRFYGDGIKRYGV